MSRRTRATQLAIIALSASVSACHSGQSDQTSATALAACDRVFEALYVQCAQAAPPADAVAHMRQRYEQVCQRGLALPGIALTPEKLSSCANAAAANGCRISSILTACLGSGTLGGDASCTESLQCASNSCSKPFLYDPDSGSTQMLACGSCGVVIPVGQPCGNGAQGQCASGAQCNLSSPNPTCVLTSTGNVGTSCFNVSGGSCNPGLYCNPFTGNCEFPQEAGAQCTGAMDCAYPLTCTGSRGQTCQNPGDAGAPCFQEGDCAKGLVCDVAANPSQCVAPRWAGGGQPCGNTVRCLVGNCSSSFFGSGGTCPVVIPDGRPCGSKNSSAETCDVFASCVNGICSLGESVACP
jgi:hypothetical protein